MKLNFKLLILCLAIPLIGGFLASRLGGGTAVYGTQNLPPFAPPGWVFGVVWPILYGLMGYSSYLIALSDQDSQKRFYALYAYALQLFLNFCWPILFFRFEMYAFSLFLLLLLLAAVCITIHLFSSLDSSAAALLIPYLLWLLFAAYLNIGILLNN